MPTRQEILAELERRKAPAPIQTNAPVSMASGPKPSVDAIKAELARRQSSAPSPQKSEIDAAIEETAASIPGGYDSFKGRPVDPQRMAQMGYVRDPLAKSGYAKPREVDLFDKAAADPASVNSPEKPWNESVADILDAGADFLLAPLDARDTGGDDPLGAVAKSVARGTAEAPGLLARDPNQFVETYDPFHQLARGYNATVDLGGDLIEGDVSQAIPKASKAVTETLGGVLGLTGLGGVVKPKPGAAAVKQAPVRQPSVRETGKALATTVLPTSAIRPQAYDAIERILLHSGVPRDRVRLGLAKVVESLKGGADSQAVGASGRQTIAQLLEREYGQEFPEVIQNLRTVLLERRLSRKAGDRSPTTIRETVQDMRGTQVPHLQESLNKNLGDASRTGTRAQVAENLKQIGQEGYKPIVSQTATPERAKSIQSVLNGPGMSELGRPLRQIAAGEGVDIEDMIAQRPIEAAHWMQHKARLLAEENGDTALGNAYNSMRDRILKTIDDLTAPDGRTYAQIRKEYGDEAGIKQALTAGDRFGALVRNPDGANQFVERFKEATPEQQSAQLASIRDWADSKLRGGPEAAAGRMTELQTIAVLDTLEKLGPQGKALADDIRVLRDEEQFLGSFYPKSESATASNAVALAQGPDIYSRGAKGGASASAVADAALMGTGMTHAPLITAMQQGPKLYRGMMQPKTATREDMTRLLMARSGEKGKGVTSPAPPPPSRTVPPKTLQSANDQRAFGNNITEDEFYGNYGAGSQLRPERVSRFQDVARGDQGKLLKSQSPKEYMERFNELTPKAANTDGPIPTHLELREAAEAARTYVFDLFHKTRGLPRQAPVMDMSKLSEQSLEMGFNILRRAGYHVEPAIARLDAVNQRFQAQLGSLGRNAVNPEVKAALQSAKPESGTNVVAFDKPSTPKPPIVR